MSVVTEYKPTTGYYRRALHQAETKSEAIEVGLIAILALEKAVEFLHKFEPRYRPIMLEEEVEDRGLRDQVDPVTPE